MGVLPGIYGCSSRYIWVFILSSVPHLPKGIIEHSECLVELSLLEPVRGGDPKTCEQAARETRLSLV